MRRPAAAVIAIALGLAAAGCSGGVTSSPSPPGVPLDSSGTLPVTSSAPPPATTSSTASSAPSGPSRPATRVSPDDYRVRLAVRTVRHLAGRVGPRPAESAAYADAADWVTARFEESGWRVTRQRFRAPAGNSWGVDVPGGPTYNLVATRGELTPGEPWLLVGAHLDTVPQAPGAEDNASGVGTLLAVARALEDRRSRLPVVLVAFGAEEPRGPTDADHHYGSVHYVAQLTPAQRRGLRGMVALDRVGVGDVVPVSDARTATFARDELLRAADRADVPVVAMTGDTASDHWSFVQEGLPGVRLGSTPYAGYHSPGDVPAVVGTAQLRRTGRLLLAWLR